MSLAKKLNLKAGMTVRAVGKPATVDLDDVVTTRSVKADALLVFVKTLAEVDAKCAPLVEAAKQDRLAWVAYPKAGQLGTDLHRDLLREHLGRQGIDTVRQVALDDVWSALRFRPGSEEAPASKPTTIDEYIAAAPEDVRPLLTQVRKRLRKVLPRAEEKIKYGMPALMLNARHAVYFAAWKHHLGLYPIYRADGPLEAELAPFRDAKDTVKFPLDAPIPYALIERIAAHMAKRA